MNAIRQQCVKNSNNKRYNNNNNNNNINSSNSRSSNNKFPFKLFGNISNNDHYDPYDNNDFNSHNNNYKHKQMKQNQQHQKQQIHKYHANHIKNGVSTHNNNNNIHDNDVVDVVNVHDDIDYTTSCCCIDDGNTFITKLIIITMMSLVLLVMMTPNCLANQQNEIFTNILRQTDSLLATQISINDLLQHQQNPHTHYKHNAVNTPENISQQQQLQQQQQQFIANDIEKLKMPDNTRITTNLSDLDKQVVERLIRQWSPIVWLAPQEKFMPLGVEEFLAHVHAETKNKHMSSATSSGLMTADMPLGDISEKAYLVTNADIEELLDDDSSFLYGRNPNLSNVPIYAIVTLCPKTINNNKNQQLLQFGTSQTTSKPLKSGSTTRNHNVAALINTKATTSYIPIPLDVNEIIKFENSSSIRRSSHLYPMYQMRIKRQIPFRSDRLNSYNLVMGETVVKSTTTSTTETTTKVQTTITINSKEKEGSDIKIESANEKNTAIVNNFIANLADNVKFSLPAHNINELPEHLDYDQKQKLNDMNKQLNSDVNVFHVTYWMFYPYSQGKNMCTLNLGPFGSIPFPTVYGYCLGSTKDIGSHIGDWEHMSLYFNGATEPESMYVSAHDAGAYYSYNRLTGSFEFKRQETRKGILQRPNFPKTVTTFNDHPVLFAAKGSHGLWTAPGKHRFVKVARLYDVNGFGTPWNTWKNVEISYSNLQNYGRSLFPSWLYFKGKWGNPKSKCHPFRLIGLNFCEYSDGPTGIPLKKPHFQCEQT